MKTAIENKPSQRAFLEVQRIARKAVNSDGWMQPVDDCGGKAAKADYGEFEQAHIDGWEETNHFEHFYGRPLTDLAEQQATRFGIDKSQNWEAYYYTFYLPLRDAFWEEWNDKQKLYEYWETNVKAGDPKKHARNTKTN